MTPQAKAVRKMPKGGRKGGSIFPRINLEEAIGFAKKLVSKTHVSAQPQDVIYAGVLGVRGPRGAIKLSAIRQYGFLAGSSAELYKATDLAKALASAPDDEMAAVLKAAALSPSIFQKMFVAFHGGSYAKAKLRQRASDLKVHPDELDACVEIYVASMVFAHLATVNGEQVEHVAEQEASSVDVQVKNGEAPPEDSASVEKAGKSDRADASDSFQGNSGDIDKPEESGRQRARAVFHVNVSLDSSLDTEKLQRQLDLLKKYGAI